MKIYSYALRLLQFIFVPAQFDFSLVCGVRKTSVLIILYDALRRASHMRKGSGPHERSAPTPCGPHVPCHQFSSLGCGFLLCFCLYGDLWLYLSQALLDVALSKVSQSVHQSIDSSWVFQLLCGLWTKCSAPILFAEYTSKFVDRTDPLSESNTDV